MEKETIKHLMRDILENAKKELLKTVQERDREGYKKRSAEYILLLQNAYGILREKKIHKFHMVVRKEIMEKSKKNGHMYPWA